MNPAIILQQVDADNAALSAALERYGTACDNAVRMNEILTAETEALSTILMAQKIQQMEARDRQLAALREQCEALAALSTLSRSLALQASAHQAPTVAPPVFDN